MYLLQKLLTKLLFLRFIPCFLRGLKGVDFLRFSVPARAETAVHFEPADEFKNKVQVPALQRNPHL